MKRVLLGVPGLGWLIRVVYRSRVVLPYWWGYTGRVLRWLLASRETTNLTYPITPLSRQQLAAFAAQVAGAELHTVLAYFDELEADTALRAHIHTLASQPQHRLKSDPHMPFGRRLVWYALARLLKPELVVETGVEKGLGSVVLCSALLRNAAQGHPGRYVGTDIDPRAGWLLTGPYAAVGQVHYGDSLSSLQALVASGDRLGLFVNDSDHSADYEAREYACIGPALTPGAVVLSDNAHVTDRLYAFAQATGRRYLFVNEVPQGHWWPGAGVGAAW